MVVFRKKWLNSGKSYCIRSKVDLFEKRGCIRAKVVIFFQSGCIGAKWCIREKVVVFG